MRVRFCSKDSDQFVATYSEYLVNFAEELLIPRGLMLLHSRLGKILFQFHRRRFEWFYQLVVDRALYLLQSIVQVFIPLVFPAQSKTEVVRIAKLCNLHDFDHHVAGILGYSVPVHGSAGERLLFCLPVWWQRDNTTNQLINHSALSQ